ncbi:MAG: NUDIX hydrolase [Sarcina sp.]
MKLVSVNKLIDCKFLSMYELDLINKKGGRKKYFLASRRKEEELACKTRNHLKADAVMIVPITDNDEFIILKQFRPAINDYIYEFPAGLVDAGETFEEAAKRELYEETGLELVDSEILIKSAYTSVGMSDETVAVIKATVKGEITTSNVEDDEEIEVIKIKKENIQNFVKNNNVSIKTALAVLSI